MKKLLIILALALLISHPAQSAGVNLTGLSLDAAALMEGIPLALEAIDISARARKREAAHAAELAKKGIAEVPPSTAALKYTINTGGAGNFLFDEWGELYIDRRFVTDQELERIKVMEAFFLKHVIEPFLAAQGINELPPSPRSSNGANGKLAVFRGFEDARYQVHDELIIKMTNDFNANKATWCGGLPEQAAKIVDIKPELVKSHMIEESGGNGPRSKAAWLADPLQVNVPGDWGREKELVGLTKPLKRNEGNVTNNVKAAIMYLSRKGFGASARPAKERSAGFFDGWPRALQRYNARRDRTETDRWYSEEYADKIIERAENPDKFIPIEIKLKAKKSEK